MKPNARYQLISENHLILTPNAYRLIKSLTGPYLVRRDEHSVFIRRACPSLHRSYTGPTDTCEGCVHRLKAELGSCSINQFTPVGADPTPLSTLVRALADKGVRHDPSLYASYFADQEDEEEEHEDAVMSTGFMVVFILLYPFLSVSHLLGKGWKGLKGLGSKKRM